VQTSSSVTGRDEGFLARDVREPFVDQDPAGVDDHAVGLMELCEGLHAEVLVDTVSPVGTPARHPRLASALWRRRRSEAV
jgi:hypothetical protein